MAQLVLNLLKIKIKSYTTENKMLKTQFTTAQLSLDITMNLTVAINWHPSYRWSDGLNVFKWHPTVVILFLTALTADGYCWSTISIMVSCKQQLCSQEIPKQKLCIKLLEY